MTPLQQAAHDLLHAPDPAPAYRALCDALQGRGKVVIRTPDRTATLVLEAVDGGSSFQFGGKADSLEYPLDEGIEALHNAYLQVAFVASAAHTRFAVLFPTEERDRARLVLESVDALRLGRAQMRQEAGDVCLRSRRGGGYAIPEDNARVDCHDRIHALSLDPVESR